MDLRTSFKLRDGALHRNEQVLCQAQNPGNRLKCIGLLERRHAGACLSRCRHTGTCRTAGTQMRVILLLRTEGACSQVWQCPGTCRVLDFWFDEVLLRA